MNAVSGPVFSFIKSQAKVVIGYVLGAFALISLIVACLNMESRTWNYFLILIFGGLLGWVTGILSTPQGPKEVSQFSGYTAAISTFLGGFLIAKIDALFEIIVKEKGFTPQAFGMALIFGSAFLLGALFTFIARQYVHDGKRREAEESISKDVEKISGAAAEIVRSAERIAKTVADKG